MILALPYGFTRVNLRKKRTTIYSIPRLMGYQKTKKFQFQHTNQKKTDQHFNYIPNIYTISMIII